MAARVLMRGQLSSRPSNGLAAFVPQCRKLVFEYCERWPSSANARTFLHNHLEEYARANPHVEFVVRERRHKQPIVRGFYRASPLFMHSIMYLNYTTVYVVNDREKVIGIKDYEVTGIQQKVQLLLDSSGAKIKPLKRRTVESTTESARGIWSGLHVETPFQI